MPILYAAPCGIASTISRHLGKAPRCYRRTADLDSAHATAYSVGMHNWKSFVTDLESWGYSLRGLARKLGCHVTTLSDIKQGRTKEPKAMLGIALLTLHTSMKRRQKK